MNMPFALAGSRRRSRALLQHLLWCALAVPHRFIEDFLDLRKPLPALRAMRADHIHKLVKFGHQLHCAFRIFGQHSWDRVQCASLVYKERKVLLPKHRLEFGDAEIATRLIADTSKKVEPALIYDAIRYAHV